MAENDVSITPLYIILGSIAYLIDGFDAAAWAIVTLAAILFVFGFVQAVARRRKI